ncbi:MAG TPA: type II toxin-antitoxin system RelE/ParE family toxin [Chitinophagales bacterium]|nr:type II toxin-antitoxin system RelE/ParE family toxin [Chitinophagales bacterium]
MDSIRKIIYYKHYFKEFFDEQTEKVKEKIDYVLFVVTVAERIPTKFLKHIEGNEGLYEIRIEFGGNIFRIFCCFDEDKLVVLFNGFQKKSQKTPADEINRALKIMRNYYEEKEKLKQDENKKKKK